MFTGIVTDVATVESVAPLPEGRRFRIRTAYDPDDIAIGASIAHAGVCLTVTTKGNADDRWYEVEAWEEALRLTTAGRWAEGTRVNTERALKLGDELGGHIVAGHVDAVAHIEAVDDEGDARRFKLSVPDDLARYVAPKGSVALDGTSLTVNAVDGARFDVLIIAHTLDVTTWGQRKVGDAVNFEADTMARYAARILSFRP